MKILFLMLHVRQDFHNSFTIALKKLAEVKEYNYLERFRAIGQDKMNIEIIELVKTFRPTVTLCIMYEDQIRKETFKAMSKVGTKVVGWFCDDRARFDNYSRHYAPYLDFSITTDAFSVPKYENLNCNVILSQWGSTPEIFKPVPNIRKLYDVSFIGGHHGGRKEYIEFLQSKGIKITCFSNRSSNYLSISDMNKVISQSKINLNFTGNSRDSSIKQFKARFFEITATGGFLLSEYAPKIEDFFISGKEIETFKTPEELWKKTKYYLEQEEEREAIAEAGYNRAIRDHTYLRRFKYILHQILSKDYE